ncbi:hypothetical protein CONLIGDRAFT_709658 [Coniochaeta ligniaria NRRL 30616]|uniref:Uncharacterized protein n=1 Tax=Coniochaeta ligniaria NRRL 30616 TaxID=1408157 RepID=A0A1J7J485_9PEZI|nr:hypothetical protein CONLIGDRAFT_709658 [Coniochaeta ligniaria NRRL 30616]
MPSTKPLTTSLGRLRTPVQTSLTRSRLPFAMQTRNTTGKGTNDGDLGGPGGQESYPESKPVHRKYAAITAAAVLTAGGVMMFMTGGPKEAVNKAGNK